jgi:hypothetical protein
MFVHLEVHVEADHREGHRFEPGKSVELGRNGREWRTCRSHHPESEQSAYRNKTTSMAVARALFG